MKTIWKYNIQPVTTLLLPEDAEFLSVQLQGEDACIWFLVNDQKPKVRRVFHAYGTGHIVSDNPGKFLGTVQFNGGSLVFHIFEEDNR